MIFRIQNAGPLRDVSIDLAKPLVILTGPNNSGKTYLAWSIYGLQHVKLGETVVPALERCITTLLSSEQHQFDLATLSAEEQGALLTTVGEVLSRDLHLCFAAKREQFEGACITLTAEKMAFYGSWSRRIIAFISLDPELSIGLSKKRTTVDLFPLGIAKPFRNAIEEKLTGSPAAISTLSSDQLQTLRVELSDRILGWLPRLFFGRGVIFPAERIAVNLFARELSLKRGELVDSILDADLEGQGQVPMDLVRRSAGRYPWPIRDALRTANDLAALSKEESPFADLAAELESAVVGAASV